MRKSHLILVLTAAITSSSVFAHMPMDSKACATIAKACREAGFARKEGGGKEGAGQEGARKEGGGRAFWQDCMKPTILSQPVKGVSVDADTIKTCRTDKITELKNELNEFEKTS